MSLDSEYDEEQSELQEIFRNFAVSSSSEEEDPYSSGIRKGRARPCSVRVPNSDNKDLRATFHRHSDLCPNVEQRIEKNFSYIDKKTGQRGLSGLPNNLHIAGLYINLYSGVYKDTTFLENNDGLFLLYQKQKNDKRQRNGYTYSKTKEWFVNNRNKEVYVITSHMGGRVLKGTLVDYDGKDLHIKVC